MFTCISKKFTFLITASLIENFTVNISVPEVKRDTFLSEECKQTPRNAQINENVHRSII